LVAGITVALVLIPQAMAYAQLAGLPPHVGLYAATLPVVIAALFGSSRQLATGPVAITSMMVGSVLAAHAGGDTQLAIALASIIAIMTGIIRIVMSIFRLGVLVNFISRPVMVGFTNAAAIMIALSQIDKIFGVPRGESKFFLQSVVQTLSGIPTHTHLLTFAFGAISLLVMLGLKRTAPRLPGVLIVGAAAIAIASAIGFEDRGGKVVGSIPTGLPVIGLPQVEPTAFSSATLLALLVPACAITFLGAMEAFATGKALALRTRQRLDTNQELLGQGLANVASGFVGGYPVSGSFSRSAVNLAAGARSPMASIVAAVLVLITLLAFTPVLYHLPDAVLAATIILAVIGLFRFTPMIDAFRAHSADGAVGITTFIITLLTAPRIEIGVLTGVVLSALLYLLRTMKPTVRRLALQHDGTLVHIDDIPDEMSSENKRPISAQTNPFAIQPDSSMRDDVTIMRYEGSLFFLSAASFEDGVAELLSDRPNARFFLLDAERINRTDLSGIETLLDTGKTLRAAGVQFLIAGLNPTLRNQLEAFRFDRKAGDAVRFFNDEQHAIRWIDEQSPSSNQAKHHNAAAGMDDWCWHI
jgi:SulP family sulfate permease